MTDTFPLLLTGFTPFDGRTVNSSWIAASSYDAHLLEIPVVWGAPLLALEPKIEACKPRTIISMGEGREGRFDIETRARNKRKHRIDNNGDYPPGAICDQPLAYQASINALSLQSKLSQQGIPIHISTDAGQFICEETLYCLERLKGQYPYIETVVFVHLPPFGTQLEYKGVSTTADVGLLSDFVQDLVPAVQNQSTQTSESADTSSHLSENRG